MSIKNRETYVVGIFFTFVNIISFGLSGIFDKVGTTLFESPITYATETLFYALLFCLLIGIICLRKKFVLKLSEINAQSLKLIFLAGIMSSGLFILFRFLGLTQATGTFASLSQIVTTTLTALLAYVFLKERLSKQFWLLFIVIIGAMYFVSTGSLYLAPIQSGDILILFGTIFLASGNMFSKLAVEKVDAFIVSIGRYLTGFILLLSFNFLFFSNSQLFSTLSILPILSGLLWALSVISFNLAIKRLNITLVTALLMISPTITMMLERFFLHYMFNPIQIIAAIIVMVSGIAIVILNTKTSNFHKIFSK